MHKLNMLSMFLALRNKQREFSCEINYKNKIKEGGFRIV